MYPVSALSPWWRTIPALSKSASDFQVEDSPGFLASWLGLLKPQVLWWSGATLADRRPFFFSCLPLTACHSALQINLKKTKFVLPLFLGNQLSAHSKVECENFIFLFWFSPLESIRHHKMTSCNYCEYFVFQNNL